MMEGGCMHIALSAMMLNTLSVYSEWKYHEIIPETLMFEHLNYTITTLYL